MLRAPLLLGHDDEFSLDHCNPVPSKRKARKQRSGARLSQEIAPPLLFDGLNSTCPVGTRAEQLQSQVRSPNAIAPKTACVTQSAACGLCDLRFCRKRWDVVNCHPQPLAPAPTRRFRCASWGGLCTAVTRRILAPRAQRSALQATARLWSRRRTPRDLGPAATPPGGHPGRALRLL